MKYKKISYLVLFLLMLVVGVNDAYAARQKKECNYMTPYEKENFNAKLYLYWGYDPNGIDYIEDFAKVSIVALDGTPLPEGGTEPLLNWIDWGWSADHKIGNGWGDSRPDLELEWFFEDGDELYEADANPECPTYLIFELNDNGPLFANGFRVWGTNSLTKVNEAMKLSNDEFQMKYASKYSGDGMPGGELITDDEFMEIFLKMADIDMELFNNELECDDLLGDKDDPTSVRGIINLAMEYVRIIVPILIILLGTIDLAKAVIAGKEDNMRKAQWDFAKRIIIGVVIFFVPVFVDIIMEFGEMLWHGEAYEPCKFFE